MRDIAESDWKLFRKLHPAALDRYCQETLAEICRLASGTDQNSHQRYLAVFKELRHRDEEIAVMFDGMRRSTALRQLASIRAHQLISDEEFQRFSAATRDTVGILLDMRSA